MKPSEARLRVSKHTADHVQEQIRQRMREDIHYYAQAGADAIEHRLQELETEWDIERTLQANAAAASLLGLFLGKTVSPKFYWLSAAVAGFLLQHALQGWCPPLPVFRRMGIRTTEEIEAERYALKLIRGDFKKALQSAQSQTLNIDEIVESVAAGNFA
ncbi:MAG: DUF2892 domain-containing protein [Desulfobacteraceae bacterium]|nr:MAG: DUF2892 domain-containing protein [Desulfobacteraceae bacterium]